MRTFWKTLHWVGWKVFWVLLEKLNPYWEWWKISWHKNIQVKKNQSILRIMKNFVKQKNSSFSKIVKQKKASPGNAKYFSFFPKKIVTIPGFLQIHCKPLNFKPKLLRNIFKILKKKTFRPKIYCICCFHWKFAFWNPNLGKKNFETRHVIPQRN